MSAELKHCLEVSSDQGRLEIIQSLFQANDPSNPQLFLDNYLAESKLIVANFLNDSAGESNVKTRNIVAIAAFLAGRLDELERKNDFLPQILSNLLTILSHTITQPHQPAFIPIKFHCFHTFIRYLQSHLSSSSAVLSKFIELSLAELAAIINNEQGYSVQQHPHYLSKLIEFLRCVNNLSASDLDNSAEKLFLLNNSLLDEMSQGENKLLNELFINAIELQAGLIKYYIYMPVDYPSARFITPPHWPFDSDYDHLTDISFNLDKKTNNNTTPAILHNYFSEKIRSKARRDGWPHLTIAADDMAKLLKQFISSLAAKLHSPTELFDELEESLLGLMALYVAVSNNSSTAPQHTMHYQLLSSFVLDNLKKFDWALHGATSAAANKLNLLILCLEESSKYHNSSVIPAELYESQYNSLVSFTAKAQLHLHRTQFVKLRRGIVDAVIMLFYCLNEEFVTRIGWDNFFNQFFPSLASPAIPPHLIAILAPNPNNHQLLQVKILPQFIKSLVSAQSRPSPSVKTVQLIVDALSTIVAATANLHKTPGTNELIRPYLPQILDTILNTLKSSPSSVGISCIVGLTRILMCSYKEASVEQSLADCFNSYCSILTEQAFIQENDKNPQDYDSNDQDIVSQLQLCTLDCLIILFKNSDLIQLFQADQDCLLLASELTNFLLNNINRPVFFNDDIAIRNHESDLLTVLTYQQIATKSSDVSVILLAIVQGLINSAAQEFPTRRLAYLAALKVICSYYSKDPHAKADISQLFTSHTKVLSSAAADEQVWLLLEPLLKP
jgi:hypothetical protein